MQEKKEKELSIASDFLKTLNIEAILETFENPDILATLKLPNSNKTLIVGIEIREHFNDEIPTELFSQGQRLSRFWKKVQEQIEKLRKKNTELSEIHAWFKLKKDVLMEHQRLNSIVRDLAEEILKFVLSESENAHSEIIVIPEWKERNLDDFTGYSLMEKYIDQAVIRKGFYAFWDANVNASHIGINIEYLSRIIEEKNLKAQSYNRSGLDELWLLIAAPHDNVFNSMHSFPNHINFHSPEVIMVCEKTTFDKIFFWSSPPHEWYKQIWPEEDKG